MGMEADFSENWEYLPFMDPNGPSEGGWRMINHDEKSCRIGKADFLRQPATSGCVRAKPCSSGKTWAKRVWTPLEGAADGEISARSHWVYRWVYHCYWKGHFREVFVDFDPRHPVNLLESVMVFDKHWQALTNNIEWDHMGRGSMSHFEVGWTAETVVQSRKRARAKPGRIPRALETWHRFWFDGGFDGQTVHLFRHGPMVRRVYAICENSLNVEQIC